MNAPMERLLTCREDGLITVCDEVAVTVNDVQKKNSDNRLLGLSRLQRRILGVARTVSEYTRGSSVPHFVMSLGVFVLYGLEPDIRHGECRFPRTKKVAAAKAALSRSIARLVRRKLLVFVDRNLRLGAGSGYVLTDALDIECVPVPVIDATLRFFHLMEVETRWKKDDRGEWIIGARYDGKQWYLTGEHYCIHRAREDHTCLTRARMP